MNTNVTQSLSENRRGRNISHFMSQCPSDMKTRKRQSLTNETRENYKSIVLNNLDTKTIKKMLLT